MIKGGAVERYGKALFDLACEEKQLERFSSDLAEIHGLLTDHPELERILTHPRIEDRDKKDLMQKLLNDEVLPFVKNFIMLIIDKGREPLLKDIIKYFQHLAREARGILEVQVYSAFELSSENKTKLATKLGDLTGKEVELNVIIDSLLIGGLKIRIGDQIIDGSIARHLERIKENLAQIQVSQLEVS